MGSKRMCPYGNDILDIADILLASQKYQKQELRFISDNQVVNNDGGIATLRGETFALTFTSRLNETFTTIPIVFDDVDLPDFVNDIQLALLNLPNRVIDGISVAAYKELTARKVNPTDTDGLGTHLDADMVYDGADITNTAKVMND